MGIPARGPTVRAVEPKTRYEHAADVSVRYGDTDQMGFAFYANYLDWFEVARTEWLRARGRTYRDLEASGTSLPVTEASCRYFSPAFYDDQLKIVAWIQELGRASVSFAYRVERPADGKLLASGHTRHAFLDRAGKPARIAPDLMELLGG